jgi:predicted DNA-binding transcriptional regulator YafY
MIENGEKNVRGGYMTQAQFDATAGKFREARTHATVADCQASSGRSKAMYQCMSSSYNHLVGCAEKHRP